MSFDKVEVRVFSGPDQVQVGSNTEPDLIVMNIGPKGDTGPNSVTSATTSDGTGQIMLDTLAVGICNILDEVVFDTLTYTFAEGSAQALKDALDISFADVSDADTGTADLSINELTVNGITTFNESVTFNEASGASSDWTFNGTIAFNTTSYAYGTGAAAAHRTALGLTTLATTSPGTNVANFLEFPTSANLESAVSDETGSGSLVFATSPTLTTAIAKGAGTTTGTAFTVQNSSATVKAIIRDDGNYGVNGYVPSAHTPTSGYAGIWLDSSNCGMVGEVASGFRGINICANATRTAGVWAQQDTSRNSFILSLGYEASNNGLTLYRATAGAGNSFSILFGVNTNGQIHVGGNVPNAAAMLQVDSTSRGFLPPRMTTTERNAIATPPAGLMIYNTTLNKLNVYNGTAWETVTSL